MGRLVRFLLVLNMWLGFNYGVLFNLYQALPTNDRFLFMFVYIVLITLPPCIFYAYITFIYEKTTSLFTLSVVCRASYFGAEYEYLRNCIRQETE